MPVLPVHSVRRAWGLLSGLLKAIGFGRSCLGPFGCAVWGAEPRGLCGGAEGRLSGPLVGFPTPGGCERPFGSAAAYPLLSRVRQPPTRLETRTKESNLHASQRD